MLEWLVLPAVGLGHLVIFVAAVNIAHAFGYDEKAQARARLVFLALYMAVSAEMAWEVWSGPPAQWSWFAIVYAALCLIAGLVLFPIGTLSIQLRKLPAGVSVTTTECAMESEGGRASWVGPGKYAWMFRLPGNESFRLLRHECEVRLEHLPRELDGLTIVQISDLHLSTSYDVSWFERVFDEAASRPADLVFFTGDLLDDDASIDWVGPLFARLKGRLGSYAILGNHDVHHHPARLLENLSAAGYEALDGGWRTVEAAGTPIAIAGTAYPWGPWPSEKARPEAGFRVLLSHSPDQFVRGERSGFDLMFSGHNHGGQVRFPIVGPVVMPSVYSRTFDRGFFRRRKMTMVVSAGLAAKHPIRYGCPPEFARLTLRTGS